MTNKTKYYITCALCFLMFIAIVIHFSKEVNTKETYKEQIKQKDSIIESQETLILRLEKEDKLNIEDFEKQKEFIETLRSKYPNDNVIDSLFRAGQSLR